MIESIQNQLSSFEEELKAKSLEIFSVEESS